MIVPVGAVASGAVGKKDIRAFAVNSIKVTARANSAKARRKLMTVWHQSTWTGTPPRDEVNARTAARHTINPGGAQLPRLRMKLPSLRLPGKHGFVLKIFSNAPPTLPATSTALKRIGERLS